MLKDEDFILSNGVKIPKIAFGTWQIPDGDVAYNSTLAAIKMGYRHIDTARAYENEKSIGRAIKDSKVKREDLFITTKLPADSKGYDITIQKFNESLANLGLDYIDLYLIHAPWPWSNVGADCRRENIECWKAMIDLYNKGLIRAIGVSNFRVDDLENLIRATNFKPHANQIRFFVGNTQNEIYNYCQKNNILIMAYSPLATGNLLSDKTVNDIAKKYNTTPAKILLRYCVEKNTLPLPKSTHEERIKSNLEVDFTLKEEDIKLLDQVRNPELDRPLRS